MLEQRGFTRAVRPDDADNAAAEAAEKESLSMSKRSPNPLPSSVFRFDDQITQTRTLRE